MSSKKYKFKLDSLLKIRKFKEKMEEIKLAKISQEINKNKEMVKKYESEIKEIKTKRTLG